MPITASTRGPKNKRKYTIKPKLPRPNKVSPGPESEPTSPDQIFQLLALPRPIRVKIWRLLGFSHTTTLRQVCSLIKEDIDQFTGISSAIDSTFDDFSFHCSTAIRKVAIHELVAPTYVEFLKYPLILEELEIRGEISLRNYLYIIKSCPNISKLIVVFNKFVIDYKTQFFPLPSELVTPKLFSKLKTIKLISATKTSSEMFYIFRTIVSLLRDTVPDVRMTTLHVSVMHKSSNVFFNEIMWTTLVFIHKHAASLRYLNLLFRDKEENSLAPSDTGESNDNDESSKDPHTTTTTNEGEKSSKKSNSTSPGGDSTKKHSIKDSKPEAQHSNSSTTRRDTGAPAPPTVSITHHHHHHHKDLHSEDPGSPVSDAEGEADVESDKSDETNDQIKDAIKYLSENAWPTADNLEHLWLTSHLNCMEQVLKMLSSKTRLFSLQLEMLGGLQSNWNFYKEFMQKAYIKNLRSVTLQAVNHSSRGRPLPIDLKIFKKCKQLLKLRIFCQKRDDYRKLSRAKNVSLLPNNINEINFERVLFTPWQIFRFLICFDGMYQVKIAYWSINDCQFSLLMAILKFVVKIELTNVRKLCLVDTKLRFKNKRRAVRKLQQAVDISVRYQDYDETRLIIDATGKPDDKAFAPRISIIKQVSDDHLRTKGIKRIRKQLFNLKGHSHGRGSKVSVVSSPSEISL